MQLFYLFMRNVKKGNILKVFRSRYSVYFFLDIFWKFININNNSAQLFEDNSSSLFTIFFVFRLYVWIKSRMIYIRKKKVCILMNWYILVKNMYCKLWNNENVSTQWLFIYFVYFARKLFFGRLLFLLTKTLLSLLNYLH